jgi:hypothetical protein
MDYIILHRYSDEARIMWNAPLPHHADAFLAECLDEHFGPGKKWHFYSQDTHNRTLVNVTSKVVDRLLKEKSKLPFMTLK